MVETIANMKYLILGNRGFTFLNTYSIKRLLEDLLANPFHLSNIY